MNESNRKRKLDHNVIQKLYNEVPSEDPMHEGFLKRLKTFDVFNWSGKPIDPPHCAKHGWEIAEKDVLKCVMCHRYLSVSLPSPSKNLPYKEACSKLVQRLASAHSKFCLYSTNPLPDSVLKIEHLSNIVLQNKIQVELLDFKNIEFKCEIPQEEKVVEIFDWLSKMADLPDVHLSSFTLVLTGWQFLKNDMLLKCNYCNRKWSLEPYLTPSNDKHDQLIVNPVTQHQRWCAWRADIHGWESRLLQLQNWKESRNREKRSRLSSDTYASLPDGMRAVRKLLNGTL